MKPTVSKANLSFAQGGGGQVVHKNKYTIVIMTNIELSQLDNEPQLK